MTRLRARGSVPICQSRPLHCMGFTGRSHQQGPACPLSFSRLSSRPGRRMAHGARVSNQLLAVFYLTQKGSYVGLPCRRTPIQLCACECPLWGRSRRGGAVPASCRPAPPPGLRPATSPHFNPNEVKGLSLCTPPLHDSLHNQVCEAHVGVAVLNRSCLQHPSRHPDWLLDGASCTAGQLAGSGGFCIVNADRPGI